MEKFVFIGQFEPYKEGLDGKRKRQYKRLLEQADRYALMELPALHPAESTTYMGVAIMNLALAYRLSGKKQYLDDAKRFMKTVISYEKWGNAHMVNVDLSASWILFGLSLGYDWLKAYLTEDEKEAILQAIESHADIIYQYRKDTYGKGWSTNFYQNHNWINMTGLAAAGYVLQGIWPKAQEYIEESKEDFERVFSYMADDGSNYEGVVYWRYGGMWLFVYAHLLKVQEGIDYFRSNNYLKNTFYYRLYQACADLKQQLNYGDCHDRYSGHPACVYYKTAAEYKNGYAQKLGNLVVDEFLMEEAANSKVKPGILPEAAFEYIWYDPDVEEKDFSDLPLTRYFEGLGLLTVRESWERTARVLTIKCGYPGGKKQWDTCWRLLREENIDCLSLGHHHPDNLAYIFTSGSEYFSCDDGYNRNIYPDNHNVLLVDGKFADAEDTNDIYKTSAKMRMQAEGDGFKPENYGGYVAAMRQDGNVVLYRGETGSIYPTEFKVKEANRLLLTDGLAFWIFVDVLRSENGHTYGIVCNTDRPATAAGENQYRYPMETGDICYTVFSDKKICARQYEQDVESITTAQEPDKKIRTHIHTLRTESAEKETAQVFFECFTFEGAGTKVSMDQGILKVAHGEKEYLVSCKPGHSGECALTPIKVTIRDGRTQKEYEV